MAVGEDTSEGVGGMLPVVRHIHEYMYIPALSQHLFVYYTGCALIQRNRNSYLPATITSTLT